jgi:oligopeptide/dipeptide ABC transporter ATP-binding protein
VPDPELEAGRRKGAVGEALSLFAEPQQGCPYHPRCPLAEEQCRVQAPELLELRPGHTVACHVAARQWLGPLAAPPAENRNPEVLGSPAVEPPPIV